MHDTGQTSRKLSIFGLICGFAVGVRLAVHQLMTKALPFSIALAVGMAFQSTPSVVARQSPTVSTKERLDVIKRAQVWQATNVAAMNLRQGPPQNTFSGDVVTCDYVDKKFGGRTPKFGCRMSGHERVLKVRYGRNNNEVYAGVAATRLLWALGFGADGLYPVRVICRGCPPAIAAEGAVSGSGAVTLDTAAIEDAFGGEEIEARGATAGWSWDELDQVDDKAGGASVKQRDALKLLAVLIQHSDNKPEQQRLVCLDGGDSRRELADCPSPFMMIHDVGVTFGRANLLNRPDVGSVNLEEWAKTPVWKTPEHCVANLSASQTGTMQNPVISEGGRRFLADLLAQLSDRQLHDMFAVARFDQKSSGGAPIDAWVAAFKQKRHEIAALRCR